jgi:fatty-acyl-CoA synthase
MADTGATRSRPGPAPEAVLERVLDVVRALARETGGPRAERAVSPTPRSSGRSASGASSASSSWPGSSAPSAGPSTTAASRSTRRRGSRAPCGRPLPGEALRLPAREEAIGAAADIGAGVGTLHESLWRHAALEPARVHVFSATPQTAGDGGGSRSSATAACATRRPLSRGACANAASRGDTVALVLPTGLDFLRSFFGVLLARAVPVPIYPPVRLDRLEEYAERQSAILRDAGARLLVTFPRARPVVSLLRPSVPTLADVVTADELAASGAPVPGPEGDGRRPGLHPVHLGQHRRAEGGPPHPRQPARQPPRDRAGLDVRPTDVGVSWLPLYHDMGLIGSWLTCLHHGLPLTLLPPTAFLARPERWLWAIHQRRATLSAAPNFAYELCARRVRDEALEGLDLSSWRVALNGAEPVSPGTIDRFARRFAPHGFRPEAMMPVYGLAECSVALAFPPVGRGPRVDRVARGRSSGEGRAEAAGPGDAGRPRVRLGRARAAGARRPHRGRRGGGRGRAGGGPPRLPRALDDGRLLPPARGHRGDHPARRLARQRRPRLPARTARSTSAAGGRTSSSRAAATSCRRRSRRPRRASKGSAGAAWWPSGPRTRPSAPRGSSWWPRPASRTRRSGTGWWPR